MDQTAQLEETRIRILRNVRRAVVKIGSAVVASTHGLDTDIIRNLAEDVSSLRKKGIECILVSSGAIAAGTPRLTGGRVLRSIPEKQAAAAVGQPHLLQAWEAAFRRHGTQVAQILLTRDDLSNRRRYLNARNTVFTLLHWNIIPVINENDTVMVEEIKFGDNDNLSSMIVSLTQAHVYINLSHIDGLCDKDPKYDPDACPIRMIPKITKKVMEIASDEPGAFGRGGMRSKLAAARKAALAGVPTVVANGRSPHVLSDIVEGRPTGTFFFPDTRKMASRKYWIAFTTRAEGDIIVDDGASRALTANGKSLLPSGIRDVRGSFRVGAKVRIKSSDGRDIGSGLVNYASDEIGKIKGCKTNQIQERLGYKFYDEVIHRDNLVLSDDASVTAPE